MPAVSCTYKSVKKVHSCPSTPTTQQEFFSTSTPPPTLNVEQCSRKKHLELQGCYFNNIESTAEDQKAKRDAHSPPPILANIVQRNFVRNGNPGFSSKHQPSNSTSCRHSYELGSSKRSITLRSQANINQLCDWPMASQLCSRSTTGTAHQQPLISQSGNKSAVVQSIHQSAASKALSVSQSNSRNAKKSSIKNKFSAISLSSNSKGAARSKKPSNKNTLIILASSEDRVSRQTENIIKKCKTSCDWSPVKVELTG